MKKIIEIYDRHVLLILTFLFLIIIPLYPKIPFIQIHDTYISIRLEDFFVAIASILFFVQALRRKVRWNKTMVILFVAFWSVGFISLAFNIFVSKIIIFRNIGLLHTLRRVEYMLPFFIAYAAIRNELSYLKNSNQANIVLRKVFDGVFWVVLLVCLYALGQKTSLLFQPVRDVLQWMSINSYGVMKDIAYFFFRFFDFPAVQTMNAEFAKGHFLNLTPESRVSSTFAGHYDLAAFLVFFLPLIASSISYTKHKIRNSLIYVVSILTLILTASRASFGAFAVSITLYFMYTKKWKGLVLTLIITTILLFANKDMTQRFMDMFQKRRVFENVQTGVEIIDQEIVSTELPAGSQFVVQGKSIPVATAQDRQDLQQQLVKKEKEEARKSGRTLTDEEALRIVNQKYKEFQNFIAKDVIAGDTSLATRTQVEWPRAWKAFLANPILGTGPSSITESTDGDYFRWFGEMGLAGGGLFVGILGYIWLTVFQAIPKLKEHRLLLLGFCAGLIALLVNATLIDVFEASKVAFTFWVISGIFIAVVDNAG
ncbi:O-antigen ligase family protein [Candidatus Woesebacteria bacterium]|nr:O-antigen ligase family protein [Candidatus Woesebacteria bacterium]